MTEPREPRDATTVFAALLCMVMAISMGGGFTLGIRHAMLHGVEGYGPMEGLWGLLAGLAVTLCILAPVMVYLHRRNLKLGYKLVPR